MGVQFKPGQSGNPAGRPKGIKNKIRYDVAEILKEGGCNPFQILAELAKSAHSEKVRSESAAELAQYVSPKLKSMEITTGEDNAVEINLNFGAQTQNDTPQN